MWAPTICRGSDGLMMAIRGHQHIMGAVQSLTMKGYVDHVMMRLALHAYRYRMPCLLGYLQSELRSALPLPSPEVA